MANETTLIIPCDLEDGKRNYESFFNDIAFSTSIVIVVLSPVAVAGNALILAAIWKKPFVRTPFHILLSGLAFTDLCTGLIAQPFYSVPTVIYVARPWVTGTYDTPVHIDIINIINIINTIGECTAIYFISITLLLITLMSIERWLHMSRRSLVTSRRGCFTVIILLLIPIPIVAFRVYHKCGSALDIMIITLILSCYLTTSFAYCKVYGIIRHHQQQVQANETSQNFGRQAIDLAKYKKSVATRNLSSKASIRIYIYTRRNAKDGCGSKELAR
ncbi:hypothetical protein ACROYT_G035858 [Oculina patagonica]